MNEIVLYSLISLLVIGIIAIGIFINFYLETKRKLFIFYIPGWIFFTLGNVGPILSIFSNNIIITQILLLSYGLLTPTGVFLIAIGGISYFTGISPKIIIILCSFFEVVSIILFITLGLDIALNFSFITIITGLISAFIAPFFKWEQSKKILGKSSRLYFMDLIVISLFIPICFVIFSQGYSFGLFNSNDSLLIMLNYLSITCGTIFTIIYFINLEFSISNKERYDLKNKYSQNMGNLLQAIYLSIALVKEKKDLTNIERSDLAIVIEEKIGIAKEFLEEIRGLK
ncbi:MAG: hypothetical protein EAX96_09995 [Candidatus Lokiarchaeota archaeon]|nr:hypothetical protein [Candidatus Lokiarchaeota archaeon]